MSFAENLKRIRKSKGLSQKELAEKLGVSQPSYAQYERGARNPKVETIRKIANALDIPVEELNPPSNLEKLASKFSKMVDETILREQNLISNYRKLNTYGKQEAIKRVSELTEIKKYTDPDKETKPDPDHKE